MCAGTSHRTGALSFQMGVPVNQDNIHNVCDLHTQIVLLPSRVFPFKWLVLQCGVFLFPGGVPLPSGGVLLPSGGVLLPRGS